MSDLAEPVANALRFDVPGCTSPRLLERDDYASLFEADNGGQRVQVLCLAGDIVEEQQLTQAFVEHAEAIGTLSQPAFLGMLDSATAGADVYVVFESPQGILLDDLCASSALLPIAVAQLGADLCAGLEALHGEGVTHGDLTPRAISLSQGELVRITPASLGCVVRNTPARRLCRRLAYQAPEAIAQKAMRGEASADIYAVGVLLWEALAGRPLLRADTVDAFVGAARAGAAPNLKIDRFVPSALTAAVQRALDRSPAARPSAAELRAQLAAIAGPAGRSTLVAATRKVRPSLAGSAQRLRVWAIPTPPPPAEPPRPVAVSECRPIHPPSTRRSPVAPTSAAALASLKVAPVPVPAPPQADEEEDGEDEETRFWHRPEQSSAKPSASLAEHQEARAIPAADSAPPPSRPASGAAQLRYIDEDWDDEIRLPIPVDTFTLIGPTSRFPAPSGEASSLSQPVPARAGRSTMRRLILAVLVCVAVLCALLVMSRALPLSGSERPSGASNSPTRSPE